VCGRDGFLRSCRSCARSLVTGTEVPELHSRPRGPHLSISTQQRKSAAYQIMLVTLLSVNFGIVFFDRNSLNFLMPFVQPDLGVSNTQVGILASALSFTWALAAFGIGLVSDKTGSRKGLLILATLAFSVCSFVSGIAGSFAMMLGARLLMGVAEGGIMPISQTLIVAEVEPRQRGLAMGVTRRISAPICWARSRRPCSSWRSRLPMDGVMPFFSPLCRDSSRRF